MVANGVEEAWTVLALAGGIGIAGFERLFLCCALVQGRNDREYATTDRSKGCCLGSRGRAIAEDVRPFASGGSRAGDLCRIETAGVPGSGHIPAWPVAVRPYRLVHCDQGAWLAIVDLAVLQHRGLGVVGGWPRSAAPWSRRIQR